jgi:acetyltransferase-like isoleucine patch superfamily enzyme
MKTLNYIKYGINKIYSLSIIPKFKSFGKGSNIKAPIINQGDEFKGPVHLSSGCWVGIGSVMLPGVKIGKNAVVGANCVVTKDVPENTVVCCVPAKTIKTLSDNEC